VSGKRGEIVCPACGAETLLRREPHYEGFVKSGEDLYCISCGHQFAGEEDVPYKNREAPRVFSGEDLPRKVEVFKGAEKGRNCRHCRHYVVNPFTQRCGLHHVEVEATDCCDQFEKKDEKPAGKDQPPDSPPLPLA
jgi:hypothetical protein